MLQPVQDRNLRKLASFPNHQNQWRAVSQSCQGRSVLKLLGARKADGPWTLTGTVKFDSQSRIRRGQRPSWSLSRLLLPPEIPFDRLAEAGVFLLGLMAMNVMVFCRQGAGIAAIPIFLYAPLPFLLWAAVRFGIAGTGVTVFSIALSAAWGAFHGRGPFAPNSIGQNVVPMQALAVVAIVLMFLAASGPGFGKARERFTRAFRFSPDAIIVSRRNDGRIIEVNERWEKMFGYRRGETIGRALPDLNIWLSSADYAKLVGGQPISDPLHDLELSLRTKTGELCHTVIFTDADDIGGEQCLITVIRDISDRKRAEEAQQNLAHASRLAVVGELTAMVAHEINQPLGAILSNADAAEMLLQSPEPPLDEIRQILSDIRKNDLRADQAIRRIRALLCKREMEMQSFDLNETLLDVLRLVTGDALRRRIQIRKEFAPGLPSVFGDRVHLQQVLLNLIVNGMDAMKNTPEPSRQLTVQTKANGAGVEVAVTDCGHGIAPDKMPRIFESFFTTKKDGMGLGLSIARSIIEAHRGRIWAESNFLGGATFHFTVRAAQT